jgi:CRP-like cAMP-binding protein
VATIAPGTWNPEAVPPRLRPFGMLVTSGLLVREVALGGSVSAELVGAGDVVLPLDEGDDLALVEADVTWTALEPTRVACLDGQFAAAVRRWPQLGVAVLRRSERRVARIALTQAIGQLTRVDDRLVALLWHLSERWGRVTPHGVVLPLRLTHRVLARLIGARRPSVTTALSGLQERGLVERRTDGAWLLLGDPPAPVAPVETLAAPWHDSRTGGSSVTHVEIGPAVEGSQSRPAPAPAAAPVLRLVATVSSRYESQRNRARNAALTSKALCATSQTLVERARMRRAGSSRFSRPAP